MHKLIFLLCLMGICLTTPASAASPYLDLTLAHQPTLATSVAAPAVIGMLTAIDIHLTAEQLIEAAEIDEDVLPLTAPKAIMPTMAHLLFSHATSPPYSLVLASLDRPPRHIH